MEKLLHQIKDAVTAFYMGRGIRKMLTHPENVLGWGVDFYLCPPRWCLKFLIKELDIIRINTIIEKLLNSALNSLHCWKQVHSVYYTEKVSWKLRYTSGFIVIVVLYIFLLNVLGYVNIYPSVKRLLNFYPTYV